MSVTFSDMFCGAGGSSIGASMAGGELRLAINHWQRAIETHAHNFRDAEHDCEDVSSLTTAQIRRYPDSDVLLASPECTNHSLAKGARRRKAQTASLFDDGPGGDEEQDRSRATMWDVCRFAEQKLLKGRPYKAIIVENVVDAYKWGIGDDGGLFRAWLQAMRAMGYAHEIVWLNSMFCPPTPQSRDRMYVVFWLKGMKVPNLRIEPKSWCPSCERIVEGRQTWKKLGPHGEVWGRYGAQYYYTCPECRGTVLPGVFPAASIIDWSLPAQRIGDRRKPLATNTRERIRRGLERLASEPFAVRLTHGKSPRPLTLPLVTQTARHDLSVVMPVAGNTYETTPGNRARDAERDPLATVHGTLDRALITRTGHRGSNGIYARSPVDPTFGLTTAQDMALVYSNRTNNVPRPAGREPSHPVLTGGHLGVVVSNYAPGWARRAGELPTGSMTTRDGHSLLVPYSTQGRPKAAGFEPSDTMTAAEKMSLVVPYMGKSRPTFAGREPAATLPTRDRLALLVPGAATEALPEALEPVTDEDIDDCLFRMFDLHEIAGAMGMRLHFDGSEYVVLGNRRERAAQYGNAVTPMAEMLLFERVLEGCFGGGV